MSNSPQKLLYNANEAAALLSISPRTLWTITSPRGPLPCVRIRNRCLYAYEVLQRYVVENSRLSL